MIRTHIFALLLALLVGAIYAAPDVYHAHTAGYKGIVMADAPDEAFYLTNINKNYESTALIGDPFQYEYQNTRNPFQYFGVEFVIGKIGATLHVPIDVLTQVMEFVFPFLLTLFVYALAYMLSASRLAGFLSAGAVLLGNEFVRLGGTSNILHTFLMDGSYREFLNYSRPVSPQVNSLFFFFVLGCLLYLLRNPRSKWAIALAGLAVGLLIYIYLYFWAFAFVVLGVIFLYALIVRNWTLAVGAGIAGVVSVVCLTPFLLANLPVFLHGGWGSMSQFTPTHRIVVEKMILLPLFLYALIYLWAWWSRGQDKIGEWMSHFAAKYIFVLLLLISGVIVSNQQVLTGKMAFQEHFHFFTNIPMFLLSMSVLGFELLTFVRIRWRILAVGTAVFTLAWFSLGVQVSSYKAHSAESLRYQMLAPIFAYLNTQAPPQSVVLADQYLSTRLTIYTQGFSYHNGGYGTAFQVPQERILNDYFVLLQLRGVTKDNIKSYLYQKDNRDEVGNMLFIGTYWRDLCGSYGCFPDSVLEALVPQYQAFVLHPLLENIKKYKIDYVLIDRVQDAEWNMNGIIPSQPLITSGDFALYLIR